MGTTISKDEFIGQLREREVVSRRRVFLKTVYDTYLFSKEERLVAEGDKKTLFIVSTCDNGLVTIASASEPTKLLHAGDELNTPHLWGDANAHGAAYWLMLRHGDGSVSFKSVYGQCLYAIPLTGRSYYHSPGYVGCYNIGCVLNIDYKISIYRPVCTHDVCHAGERFTLEDE